MCLMSLLCAIFDLYPSIPVMPGSNQARCPDDHVLMHVTIGCLTVAWMPGCCLPMQQYDGIRAEGMTQNTAKI